MAKGGAWSVAAVFCPGCTRWQPLHQRSAITLPCSASAVKAGLSPNTRQIATSETLVDIPSIPIRCKCKEGSLLLLNTLQVVDNGENTLSHNDLRVLVRTGKLPVSRINIVGQVDDGV